MKNLQQPKACERKSGTEELLDKMTHLSTCNSSHCKAPGCSRLKRVLQHTRGCRKKIESSCPVCRQFLNICILHEKGCDNKHCRIYFCNLLRWRMAQRNALKHQTANKIQLTAAQGKYGQRQNEHPGSVLPRKMCGSFEYNRSLSLQIPLASTGNWSGYQRSESLGVIAGSAPETVGPRNSLLTVEKFREMTLNHEGTANKDTTMETI